ncbi:MAG: hypothetical protein KGJ62_01645 [Armatimonadetes bacterium]|nr:hypothetical protein [Armatimonadota bacterium]MDE2205484.1 hypothetical protein [Armatimonadota bacterium]
MAYRFSDHFRLGKSQAELDFIDIPLTTDIPLFVDPYALSLADDIWYMECNDLIVDFFQLVVDSIRSGDTRTAGTLLLNLHEPNETHLGLSSGRPAGRGIGRHQANQIYSQLSKSRAVASGQLRDLSDCELLIEGISNDKISDVTVNIIRGKLLEYTETQCTLLGIPTRKTQSGFVWNSDRRNWENRYVNLPTYQGERLILVPKAATRFRLAVDHQEYHRNFVLEYLQAENLEAATSLVKVLKNGKRVVTKTDLKEKYPCSKAFLAKFSEEHPDILEEYKKSLAAKPGPPNNEEIEGVQTDRRAIDVRKLIDELDSIPPGGDTAGRFHAFIMGALEVIFYPSLRYPKKEQEIHDGRKRIDISFQNSASKGFFFDLKLRHDIPCPYVFAECKNYKDDPVNPELDQLAGRFSPNRGKCGLLVCRSIQDRDMMTKRCRDAVNDDRGFILALDDTDIRLLLEARASRDDEKINRHLHAYLRQLVM